MAISANHLLTADDGTDQQDYTTGSISPTANRLIVICSGTRRADSVVPDVPTVTGNGLTYTLIQDTTWDDTPATLKRLFIHAAWSGSSPSAGGVTFDFASGTQTHLHFSITEFNGTDGANGVVQSFVQTVETGSNPSGNGPLGLVLAAASNANNRPFVGFVQNATAAQPNSTPSSGWTALGSTTNQDSSRLHTSWRSDAFDTAVDPSWAAEPSQYGGIAAEIKAAAAASVTRKLQTNVSPRRW